MERSSSGSIRMFPAPTLIPVAGMSLVTTTLIVCGGSPAAVTVTVVEPGASASSVRPCATSASVHARKVAPCSRACRIQSPIDTLRSADACSDSATPGARSSTLRALK